MDVVDGAAIGRGRGGMHGMRGRIGEQHMGGRTGVQGGSAKIMAPLARRGKAIGGSDELVTGRSHGLRHELSPIHGGGGESPRLWRRFANPWLWRRL